MIHPRNLVILTMILVVAGILAIIFSIAPAHAQETVALEGQVVNGTPGSELGADLSIILHSFDQVTGDFSTQETTANELGQFTFTDVPLMPNGGYAVTAEYGGTRYSQLLSPEDLSQPMELLVYETTQDISVIRVEQQALILTGVDSAEQTITAAVFVSLYNDSQRTLVPDLANVGPGQFSFLRFSLPPLAESLDVDSDLLCGEIIPVGSGFAMTAPVTPGQHSISYSFRFPYQNSQISHRQSLLQGADLFQVLIPERFDGITVKGLQPAEPLATSEAAYLVWEAADLSPGQGAEFTLENLPRSNLAARAFRTATEPEFWQVAMPVTLGAFLAALLVYGGFFARRVRPSLASDAPTVTNDIPDTPEVVDQEATTGNAESLTEASPTEAEPPSVSPSP